MDLLVLAKEPVPGRVKTRLDAALRTRGGGRHRRGGPGRHAHRGDGDHAPTGSSWRSTEQPGSWCPPGAVAGGPGQRGSCRPGWPPPGEPPAGPALQIGMDTPHVGAAALDQAMALLGEAGGRRRAGTGRGRRLVGHRVPSALDRCVLRNRDESIRHRRPAARPARTARDCARRCCRVERDVDTWEDALRRRRRPPARCVRRPRCGRCRPGSADGRPTCARKTATRSPSRSHRWRSEPDEHETALLAQLVDPVLDIGCGPGRVPTALAASGRLVLGIDPAAAAADEAARRGAPGPAALGVLPAAGRGPVGDRPAARRQRRHRRRSDRACSAAAATSCARGAM